MHGGHAWTAVATGATRVQSPKFSFALCRSIFFAERSTRQAGTRQATAYQPAVRARQQKRRAAPPLFERGGHTRWSHLQNRVPVGVVQVIAHVLCKLCAASSCNYLVGSFQKLFKRRANVTRRELAWRRHTSCREADGRQWRESLGVAWVFCTRHSVTRCCDARQINSRIHVWDMFGTYALETDPYKQSILDQGAACPGVCGK